MKKLVLVVLAFAVLGIVPAFAQAGPSPNPVSTTLNFTLKKDESLSMSAAWAGGANVFTMAFGSNNSDVLGINITGTWNLAPTRNTVDYCFNLTGAPTNADGVSVPASNFFGGTTATPSTQLSTSATDCGATTGAKKVAAVTLTAGNRQNSGGILTPTFLQVQGATTQAGNYTGGVLTIYAFAN
jgi:hypothetical protein